MLILASLIKSKAQMNEFTRIEVIALINNYAKRQRTNGFAANSTASQGAGIAQ
jgi:hypothetical protein